MQYRVGVSPGTTTLLMQQNGLGQPWFSPGGAKPAPTLPASMLGAPGCAFCAGSRTIPAPVRVLADMEQQENLIMKVGLGGFIAVLALGVITTGIAGYAVVRAVKKRT